MSTNETAAEALIYRWIIDYQSRVVWKQFEQIGQVKSSWTRSFLEIGKRTLDTSQILSQDNLENKCQLLIELMYGISEGETVNVAKSRTFLEDALHVLEKLNETDLSDFIQPSNFKKLKLSLKQQAVLVCCRANEFNLAKDVFQRVWTQWINQQEMNLRANILDAIQTQNSKHPYLKSVPYSQLLDESRLLLREFFNSAPVPFLSRAAHNIYKKLVNSSPDREKYLAVSNSESNDETIETLIIQWIIDYQSHLVWEEFENTGQITSSWFSEFITESKSKLDNLQCEEDLDIIGLLLIEYISNITESGIKTVAETDSRTFLEHGLTILNKLIDKNFVAPSFVAQTRLMLEEQAVLYCCRENQFDTADNVFDRLWNKKSGNQREMKVKASIEAVLKSRNSKHNYLQTASYTKFLDQSKSFLKEFFHHAPEPFLKQAAKKVCEKVDMLAAKESSHPSDGTTVDSNKQCSIDDSDMLKETVNATQKKRGRKNQVSGEIIKAEPHADLLLATIQSHEDVSRPSQNLKNQDDVNLSMVSETSYTIDNESDESLTHTKLKRSKNVSDSDIHDSDTDLDVIEKKKGKISTNSKQKSDNVKKVKKAWLPEEEELIYKGVQKYGFGNWAIIAKNLLVNRSNVDVKDKWRTMVKQGKLKLLNERYGPYSQPDA